MTYDDEDFQRLQSTVIALADHCTKLEAALIYLSQQTHFSKSMARLVSDADDALQEVYDHLPPYVERPVLGEKVVILSRSNDQ